MNIRSIVRPTCSREPTDHQWEQLEEALTRLTHGATADPAESVVRSAVGAIEVARWQRRFKLAPTEPPAELPPSRY